VLLLHDRLRPVPVEASKQLAQLIADLDADDFRVRERAKRELEKLAPAVEPTLRKRSVEGNPSLEMRKRLDRLLEVVRRQHDRGDFPGEFVRSLRAVALLEQIGTTQAREVLKSLSAGAPGFRLTQEAQASLLRLEARRSSIGPT
jgi:hypothetical protein